MASSVERFGRYANCSGSSMLGNEEMMKSLTRRSKHFITTEALRTRLDMPSGPAAFLEFTLLKALLTSCSEMMNVLPVLSGDIHVYQRKCACERHDDGTVDGYQEIAFDGKELLVFDKERAEYVPVTEEAEMVAHLWNIHYESADSKVYVENDCIENLKLYLPIISTDLEKKVRPKVKVSSSESESGTKLHCRVYGFYPRDVEVKWIKNGRDEIHSEEAAQILPNPDGTYQIRVRVGVTPEGGATYSCHIDHSSLEKPLVVPFEPSNRSRLYIIPVGAVLLLLLVVLRLLTDQRRKKDLKISYKCVSTEDKDSKFKYTPKLATRVSMEKLSMEDRQDSCQGQSLD
ncbi:major histocompatibility complex class I-related gene protein-like [Xenopus tropicalis]|uniref:Major histocompatibility complex class I-related gene protein-like n=1 Tax=Xenopus tropicalis TaxID=8364 RepID=A0A8J1IQ18_XENTR|nr:major histocompatibility complex class I-related gene protein-like [Xenopus tropicalis]